MQTGGLTLDQAPPLSIPASFFLTAPAAILLAGALLLGEGAAALATPWAPVTLALTHLGTLGFLGMVMFGALYQMTPVVAGTPVPAIRLAHGVHALVLLGLGGFLWRLVGGPPAVMHAAVACLVLGVAAFDIPVGWGLARATAANETVWGMRLAIASLTAVALLGAWMARGHAGGSFAAPRGLWVEVHLSLALLGWVGGLLTSVSYQVIPMFYLATPFSLRARRCILLLCATSLLPLGALLADPDGTGWLAPSRLAALAALPAAVGAWALHPLVALRSIAARKRKRADGSLLFWKTGLAVGCTLIPAAAAAHFAADPRWGLLFGWLALWGWAGLIVHGMLTRILPFLVWFHRLSHLIGKVKVPSMRSLLSQRRIQVGYGAHTASLVLGAVAIATQHPLAARATGALLVLTGLSLLSSMVHVLRQGPPAASPD